MFTQISGWPDFIEFPDPLENVDGDPDTHHLRKIYNGSTAPKGDIEIETEIYMTKPNIFVR